MTTFSGASTPRFDSGFDMGFGTPNDLFSLNEKHDYFSGATKMQSDYGFPGLFSTSPYPTQMDITPPQTATDPPPNWPYGMEIPEQSIESSFEAPKTTTSTAKIQYGQTTPPDEAMRAPDMDELKDSFPNQSTKSSKRNSTVSVKPSKPSKRSKKNKNEDVNEENDKRSKFLERNRVAASKCRQKKKEYNGQLEQKAKTLERDNAFLKMELEKYQTEKINLMTAMALHTPSECECHALHQHLESFKAQFSDPPSDNTRTQDVSSANSVMAEEDNEENDE